MTVYIEYVIIDNLIIDYLMLKATFVLTGKTIGRGRLFLCAFFGAAVALTYPLLQTFNVILSTVKILTGLLIVLLAANYNSFKSYYVTVVLFFALTFLTGGAITGAFNLLGLDASSEISIALMVFPVYVTFKIAVSIIRYLRRSKHVSRETHKIEMFLGNDSVNASGFFDTGNALYDGDRPVVVCEKRIFTALVKNNLLNYKLKKIDVSTVNGQSQNLAVELDKIMIYIGDKVNIHNNVTLCLVKGIGNGYDVILHPALMESCYDEDYEKTCQVS